MIFLALSTSPASSQGDCPYESYAVWCDNGNPLDGFWYQQQIWTPGLISVDTWFTPTPAWTIGKATFYYPGLMRATAEYRGMSLDGYLGGVSLMTCADLGFDVWLRRPDHEWEGPYLSVDCARRGDLYGVVIGRGEAVEVSWDTAKQWGMVSPGGKIESWNLERVQVSKIPPNELAYTKPVVLADWFESILTYECCTTDIQQPLYEHPRTWRIQGEWTTFPVPTAVPLPTPTAILQESENETIVVREPDEDFLVQGETEMIPVPADQVVAWIVGAILGIIGAPTIFQWIKNLLGWEGKPALLLVMGLSVVIAVIALAVTGGFSPFSLENLLVYLSSIIALSQVTYGLFIKS